MEQMSPGAIESGSRGLGEGMGVGYAPEPGSKPNGDWAAGVPGTWRRRPIAPAGTPPPPEAEAVKELGSEEPPEAPGRKEGKPAGRPPGKPPAIACCNMYCSKAAKSGCPFMQRCSQTSD